ARSRFQNFKEMLAALVPCTDELGAFSHEQLATYIETLFSSRPRSDDEITHEADENDIIEDFGPGVAGVRADADSESLDIDIESDLALAQENPAPQPPRARTLPAALFAVG